MSLLRWQEGDDVSGKCINNIDIDNSNNNNNNNNNNKNNNNNDDDNNNNNDFLRMSLPFEEPKMWGRARGEREKELRPLLLMLGAQ